METEQCSNCRFYNPCYPNSGFCRRHAPARTTDSYSTPPFPSIESTEWCGEYERDTSKRPRVAERPRIF